MLSATAGNVGSTTAAAGALGLERVRLLYCANWKIYLSKLPNLFVQTAKMYLSQIAKCICATAGNVGFNTAAAGALGQERVRL